MLTNYNRATTRALANRFDGKFVYGIHLRISKDQKMTGETCCRQCYVRLLACNTAVLTEPASDGHHDSSPRASHNVTFSFQRLFFLKTHIRKIYGQIPLLFIVVKQWRDERKSDEKRCLRILSRPYNRLRLSQSFTSLISASCCCGSGDVVCSRSLVWCKESVCARSS